MRVLIWLLLLPCLAQADEGERRAAVVTALHGDLVVLDPGEEPGVGPGAVLTVWRQLPSARGTADYRKAALWWEVGTIRVDSVGANGAVARFHGPPSQPIPAELDESGAPPDRVHVGDFARATGAVAERRGDVRVTFARADLFSAEQAELKGSGKDVLAEWLRGLESMEGPIRVEVHPEIEEMGVVGPDLARAMSADEDAPFGPAPGKPVVPVDELYEGAPRPLVVPPAREVLVVHGSTGVPETWRYLDPVSLAERQGQDVAAALAGRLGIDRGLVSVAVVPRPVHEDVGQLPGYDAPGDQVRIVARAIQWSKAPPKRPRTKKPTEKKAPAVERSRKRRILEKPPEEISGSPRPRPLG